MEILHLDCDKTPKTKQMLKNTKPKLNESNGKHSKNNLQTDSEWIKLGLKLISKQRLSNAVRCFEHALRINPYNINAYYYKGKCCIWLNRGEEGINCFDMVMKLQNKDITSIKIAESLLNPEIETAYNNSNYENNSIFPTPDKIISKSEGSNEGFNKGLESKNKSKLKKKMVIDFKNKLDALGNSKPFENPLQVNDKDYPHNHVNMSYNNELDNNELEKNINQIGLEPYDLSKHRHQRDTFESEIMPEEGGIKRDDSEFMRELLEYQRYQINNAIEFLREHHGGGFYYYVDHQYLFKLELFLLQTIIDDYHMDGVVISIDKPAYFIQRILSSLCESKYQPYYIDLNENRLTLNNPETDMNNIDGKVIEFYSKKNISYLGNNFNFSELLDAIEINLQNVAELYEGENHFVFFDNIAGFQNYCSDREIKKFVRKLELKLRKLNLFGFFMVPNGQFNLTFLDSIQSFSASISDKLNFKK